MIFNINNEKSNINVVGQQTLDSKIQNIRQQNYNCYGKDLTIDKIAGTVVLDTVLA